MEGEHTFKQGTQFNPQHSIYIESRTVPVQAEFHLSYNFIKITTKFTVLLGPQPHVTTMKPEQCPAHTGSF